MPAAIEAAAGRPPLQQRLRVGLVGLGISVVPLDTSVNIAFPDITGSFGLPTATIQWVVICYVLTHAALMLAFGRVGDMWSHARVFRAGLLWNMLAFVACARAPSFEWLLFCRFLQGIGAGLIISCAPALVTSLYPEGRRSHAVGVFTLMFALGSAAGPFIGGVLVATWGWPGVFWFRAPIALTALLLLHGLPTAPRPSAREPFDIAGAALLACGLAALLLAVNRLPHLGEGDFLALPLFAAALGCLAGFLWWEARAVRPIVRLELFCRPGFAVINLAGAVLYLATFSVLLFAPYFFARFSPLPLPLAGAVLATGFISMAVAATPAAWLIARIGAVRVASLGAVLTGAGLALISLWPHDAGAPAMVATLALQGLGLGLFQVSYMDIVMAALPPADRGVAGSLSMLVRTIGTVSGAALLTLGFQAVEGAASAGGSAPPEAFLAAFRGIFRAAGATAILAAVLVARSARSLRRR